VRRIVLALALCVVAPAEARAGEQWPSWPTEVDRVAAVLHNPDDRIAGERERAMALARLEMFATPAIEDEVVRALQDPASQVRREALRLCYLRRLTRCIDEASRIWGSGIEPTLRVAALRVLALDLDTSRLALLLAALRDPSDELRAQAAQILGWATAPRGSADEVRAALLAKLSDSAALVRRRAVESLGLLGPGTGTLAMARLLEDPEPTVRAAAAEALARSRDERAAPALVRAVDGQNEAVVSRKILDALALLPGQEVATALLRKLDDPPPGLSAFQVADAIGNRPEPEPELIEGLVDRLREPDLDVAVLQALLRLGKPTEPVLRRALERGLDPSLQLEIEGLLIALEPPAEAVPADVDDPAAEDAKAWASILRTGTARERFESAARLGALAPSWLDSAVTRRVERRGPIEPVLAWLVAAATASRPLQLGGTRWLPWARLQGWAVDRSAAPGHRCLALVTLARAPRRSGARRVKRTVAMLLADPEPRIRSCAALASARWPELAELALEDPEPSVRAAAALTLRVVGQDSPTPRLAATAALDPSPAVRSAASAPIPDGDPVPAWFSLPRPLAGWVRPDPWIQVRIGETSVQLPALASGDVRWCVAPLPADAEVIEPEPLR
jgi:HEAT repeat protein